MPDSLSTSLSIHLTGTFSTAAEVTGLQGRASSLDYSKTVNLANGTAANQADVLWSDYRTTAQGGGEDLDLVAGLTNIFGAAASFAKLKQLIIEADTTNTMNVVVTRPGANGVPFLLAAGDGISIPPGGGIALYAPALAGWCTVTADTGDLIHIASSGAAEVKYKIYIIGTSA